eukprot:57392-Rhodomonas_salina.1
MPAKEEEAGGVGGRGSREGRPRRRSLTSNRSSEDDAEARSTAWAWAWAWRRRAEDAPPRAVAAELEARPGQPPPFLGGWRRVGCKGLVRRVSSGVVREGGWGGMSRGMGEVGSEEVGGSVLLRTGALSGLRN